MSNIDELIEQLRKSADFEDYPIVASFAAIIEKKYLREAANALEKLQVESEQAKAERDAAIKDLNEFLSMDELCPIQCEWCKWNGTCCDGKTPEWRGVQNE